MFGKHLPDETRRKLSDSKRREKNPMHGVHLIHSDETRRKIGEALSKFFRQGRGQALADKRAEGKVGLIHTERSGSIPTPTYAVAASPDREAAFALFFNELAKLSQNERTAVELAFELTDVKGSFSQKDLDSALKELRKKRELRDAFREE